METTHMPQDVLTVPTAAPSVERTHQGKCRTPSRRPDIAVLAGLQGVQDDRSGQDYDRPGSNRDGHATRGSLAGLGPWPRRRTIPPEGYL